MVWPGRVLAETIPNPPMEQELTVVQSTSSHTLKPSKATFYLRKRTNCNPSQVRLQTQNMLFVTAVSTGPALRSSTMEQQASPSAPDTNLSITLVTWVPRGLSPSKTKAMQGFNLTLAT